MTTQVRGRAAREAKLEAPQEQLSESVAALVTGEDWKRALTFAAQFRGRSFGNSMLIAAQHFAAYNEGRVPQPTPTYVAGFHQWLSLGRSVAKPARVRHPGSGDRPVRLVHTGRPELLAASGPQREADVRRVRPHPDDRRQADLRLGHLIQRFRVCRRGASSLACAQRLLQRRRVFKSRRSGRVSPGPSQQSACGTATSGVVTAPLACGHGRVEVCGEVGCLSSELPDCRPDRPSDVDPCPFRLVGEPPLTAANPECTR
jgi:hypothetical protein